MKNISLYLLVIVLSVGSAAMVRSAMRTQSPNSGSSSSLETSGAFRDGLYLGKLAAKNGHEPRITGARWSRDEDRAAFREGYERGFTQMLNEQASARD
jgi:hypothetical protein